MFKLVKPEQFRPVKNSRNIFEDSDSKSYKALDKPKTNTKLPNRHPRFLKDEPVSNSGDIFDDGNENRSDEVIYKPRINFKPMLPKQKSIDDVHEDDPYVVKVDRPMPLLSDGNYTAIIGNIVVKKKPEGINGEWNQVTIPFIITSANLKKVTVYFKASTILKPKSRLYPIIKGILGEVPEGSFNLRSLQGKKVVVTIGHTENPDGSIRVNVLETKRAS